MGKAKDKTVISKLYDYFNPRGENYYFYNFFSGKDYTPEDVLSFILGEASPDKAYSISAGMKKDRGLRMAVYGLDRHRDRHLGLPLPPEYDREIENYAGEDPPTWDDVAQYIYNNTGLKDIRDYFENQRISFRERPIVTWRVNRAASYDDGLMRLLRRYGGLHDMDIDTRLLISYLSDPSVSPRGDEYAYVYDLCLSENPERRLLFEELAKGYVGMVNRPPVLPGGARCMDESINLSFEDLELGDIACERFILERYFDREEIDDAAASLAPNYATTGEEQRGSRGFRTAHPVGRLLNRFGAEVTALENCSYDDFLMLMRRGYPIISFAWSPGPFDWNGTVRERAFNACNPSHAEAYGFHQSYARFPSAMGRERNVSCVLIFPAWCKGWDWEYPDDISPLVYVPREGLTEPFSMVDKNFIDPSFCSDARAALIRPAACYYEGYAHNVELDIDFSRLVIFRPPKSWKAKKWDFTPGSVAYRRSDSDFKPRVSRHRENYGTDPYDFNEDDYYEDFEPKPVRPAKKYPIIRNTLRLFDVEPHSLRKETIPGGISEEDTGRFRFLTGQTDSNEWYPSSDE